jgi:hypothetical protein
LVAQGLLLFVTEGDIMAKPCGSVLFGEEVCMLRVKGIYDGAKIVLLEPLPVPPHTPVEVLIPEGASDAESAYWQRLLDLGLLDEIRPLPIDEDAPEPIQVAGPPISETIIRERR